MSFDAMCWALKQDDVKGLTKWVLFLLCYRDRPDPPHGCYPSIRTLAADCGVNKSTVCYLIDELVGIGKVQRIERPRVGRYRSSTLYWLPGVWGTYAPDGQERLPLVRPRRTSKPVACTSQTDAGVRPGRTERFIKGNTNSKPRAAENAASSLPPCGKVENLTAPQKRYAQTAKLIQEAEHLMQQGPRGFADLKEDVKRAAAKKGLDYDADMISNAIDIAERRRKVAS